MIQVNIEGKNYQIPKDTRLGDHLYHRDGSYFIDTQEKFDAIKIMIDKASIEGMK